MTIDQLQYFCKGVHKMNKIDYGNAVSSTYVGSRAEQKSVQEVLKDCT